MADRGNVKSADAFRTISEVSKELDVPQHVLRFWETKFSQIKPMKRAGGRRYYRPDDVALILAIRGLLYDDGYTIKGVQKVLKDRGVKAVLDGLSSEEGVDFGKEAEMPKDDQTLPLPFGDVKEVKPQQHSDDQGQPDPIDAPLSAAEPIIQIVEKGLSEGDRQELTQALDQLRGLRSRLADLGTPNDEQNA